MNRDSVPFSHPWDEAIVGEVASVIVGGTPNTAISSFWGGDISWMASGDVHSRHVFDVPGRITELGLRCSNAEMVEPKAVAVALAGQGKTRGTVAITHIPLCTNQSVALIKPHADTLEPTFLYQSLLIRYEELRSRSAGGGRAGLTKTIIEAVPVQLPPLTQQRKIARILTTLDNLIEKTEALIAKHQAVKQGMMHDLFTRGVDEHGQLRPAQAEAPELYKESELGWIPKEWSSPLIGPVLRQRPRNGYSPKESDEWTGTVMLGLGCLTPTGFEPVQLKNAPKDDPNVSSALLRDGDILISRSNTRELVALVGIYHDIGIPCIYSDLMMRLVPTDGVLPEYLEAVLRHSPVRRQLTNASCGTSGSMMKINAEMVVGTVLPLPRKDEQQQILDRLASANDFIAQLRQERDKCQSLKRGLMKDLLTGTVRVKADEAKEGTDVA